MTMIIDMHAHVFPDAIAKKASESVGHFYDLHTDYYDGTVSRLLELEREAGIERTCIHSVAVTPRSIDSINRFISDTVRQYPDRFIGFAAIHPEAEDIPGLVVRAREMGLQGFKIHPDMQKFALDSPEAMEMFAAIEGKMPIIIHTGDRRYSYSNPSRMRKVLEAFPRLVCICAHLGGWSEWEEAWQNLAEFENAWVDTSSSIYALGRENARRIIRHYSRERILFGTDYPMWNPGKELEMFLELGLTEEENERILARNAQELLDAADGDPVSAGE